MKKVLVALIGFVSLFSIGVEAQTTVTAVSPSQNDIDVSVSTNIQVTFDTAIDTATVTDSTTFRVTGLISGLHRGAFTFNGDSTILTFNPDDDFLYGELVVVTIASGIQDDSNSDITPFIFSFTTSVLGPDGTFESAVSYSTGSDPFAAAIGDLDGDGYADIVVANLSSDNISVLINNGDSTFAYKVNYTSGSEPISVGIGDLNNDGFLDVVTSNQGDNTASVFINDGDGTFASKVDYSTGSVPSQLNIGDFDGDGYLDFLVANYSSSNFSIHINNGDGTFAAAVGYGSISSAFLSTIGDFDGDGFLDAAIVGSSSSIPTVFIYTNDGDGTFTYNSEKATGSQQSGIHAGDIDEDGDLDLAISSGFENYVSIFKGNGDGSFESKVDYNTGANTGTAGVFFQDIDGDGDLDLSVTLFYADGLSTFLNNGSGIFSNQIGYAVGSSPYLVAAGDLNNDGVLDLVTANAGNNTISVLMGSKDVTAPVIQSLSPADGGTLATGISDLIIAFDEEVIAQASKNISIYTSADDLVEQIAANDDQITVDGAEVSIALTDLLVNGDYYIQIDAGTFEDEFGNAFAGIADETTWNFTVDNPETDSIAGNLIDLPGTASNYVNIPYSSSLNPSDNFTIEFWAKPEGGAGGYRAPIASEDTKNGNTQMGYYFYASNGDTWQSWIGKGVDGGWSIITGPAVTIDEWAHLAMTYSGGTQKFYVNGVLADSVTGVPFVANDNKPFTIGAVSEITSVFNWNGKIDEIRLWGVVRSEKEIRENMHRTIPGEETVDLIMYLQMNEGTGTTTDDVVGGFTGTFVNSPVWATSTIPAGVGTSSSANSSSITEEMLLLDLDSVLVTDFADGFDNDIDITVTKIRVAPNLDPAGYTSLIEDKYWVVNAFGDPGTFNMFLGLTVPSGFITQESDGTSHEYRLYHRESVSDDDWTMIQDSASVSVSDNILMFSGITEFGQFAVAKVKHSVSITGTEGWRLLSSPVESATYSTLVNNFWTQGFTGADYSEGTSNVYSWDNTSADTSKTNWDSITNQSDNITAGSGVLVYIFEDDDYETGGIQGGFPKTLDISGTEHSGTQVLSSLLNGNVGGWSFLGNPFYQDIDWDLIGKTNLEASVYVWDHNSLDWKTWNGSTGDLTDGIIPAFNGFFVQTSASSPAIAVAESTKVDGDVGFLGKEANKKETPAFSLKVTNEYGLENSAWFSFMEGGSLALDAFDAHKLEPLSSEFLQLSSLTENGLPLDINNLPLINHEIEIPLNIESSVRSEITMSLEGLPVGWTVKLIDHETDNVSDLSEDYHFELEAVAQKRVVAPDIVPQLNAAKAMAPTPRFTLRVSSSNSVTNEWGSGLPQAVALDQNYPNPFNPSTVIRYQLPVSSEVSLKVFDVLGREVANLIDGRMEAGYHQVTFNARDLASGMYIYQLRTGSKVITKKLTLIK